jgi:acyl-CoA thioester hydrolase
MLLRRATQRMPAALAAMPFAPTLAAHSSVARAMPLIPTFHRTQSFRTHAPHHAAETSPASPATASPYYVLPPLSRDVTELLRGYSDLITIHPAWGEQDTFGHVNNAVYIRWVEASRIHWLMKLGETPIAGMEQAAVASAVAAFISGRGIGPILKSVFYDFKSPVTYPDLLIVGARLHSIGSDRFSLTHRLVSVEQEKIVGESEGVIVTFEYESQRKANIPSVIRQAMDVRMEQQRQSDLLQAQVKAPRTSQNFGPQEAGTQ